MKKFHQADTLTTFVSATDPWQLPKDRLYDLSDTPIIERQKQQESAVRSYPRRLPLAIKKAKGSRVMDERNQVFLDCLACAGALPLGHNHPEVTASITEAIKALCPWQTLDITSPAKDAFTSGILSCFPKPFAKNARLQFCGPSGADAVEAAIKLAKTATQRQSIISFQGGYHGMTHGALALTGNLSAKRPLSGLMPDVHFMPYPYPFRSAFGEKNNDNAKACLHYLRSQLLDPEGGITKPAAIIVEIVQGEGGVIPAPIAWLQGLRELTTQLGILLIVDEIQTGIGRTGHLFAFERAEITPDIVILSKAIGGGLPLSVIAFDEAIDAWSPGAHAGTFRGNQLAFVSGLKTLEIIQRDRLYQNADLQGAQIKSKLQAMQQQYPQIGEVRGQGLMLGIEIVCADEAVDDLGHLQADAAFAQKVQLEALKRGLICELGGRFGAVIRLLPPLIITAQEAEFITDTLSQAFAAAASV